jgi:hypothetical protein
MLEKFLRTLLVMKVLTNLSDSAGTEAGNAI